VSRAVRELRAGDRFRAVPVVVIEINDQNPAAARGLIIARSNRNVIEEAKAHSAIRLGVMTGWTNECKDRTLLRYARPNGSDRAAGSASGNAKGGAIDDCVAGRKIRRLPQARRFSLDQLDVCGRVDALDLFVARIASWNGLCQNSQSAQARGDHLNAVGTLGMSDPA
jgi:hypothetical protein